MLPFRMQRALIDSDGLALAYFLDRPGRRRSRAVPIAQRVRG
jgi:hypothetical protein